MGVFFSWVCPQQNIPNSNKVSDQITANVECQYKGESFSAKVEALVLRQCWGRDWLLNNKWQEGSAGQMSGPLPREDGVCTQRINGWRWFVRCCLSDFVSASPEISKATRQFPCTVCTFVFRSNTHFCFSFYFVVLCASRGGGRLKASVLTNWYPSSPWRLTKLKHFEILKALSCSEMHLWLTESLKSSHYEIFICMFVCFYHYSDLNILVDTLSIYKNLFSIYHTATILEAQCLLDVLEIKPEMPGCNSLSISEEGEWRCVSKHTYMCCLHNIWNIFRRMPSLELPGK